MLKNYLITAARNFQRQRLFSFINVIGLSTGLACTLFIFLWISDETDKDKFHTDIDRIYHALVNIYNPEGTITWAITPGPLAEEIKSSIPEIEFVAPVADDGPRLVQVDDNSYLPSGYFTYPEFFKIFSYKIIEGDASNPLPDASSIVLTKSLATKLFGNTSAIGKALKIRSENDVKITAVMEDAPAASSLKFEFIAHFDVHKKYRPQDWSNSDYPLFLKFRDNFNAKETQDKINKHVAKVLNLSEEDSKRMSIYLQPFADRYLYASFENGYPTSGRIKYVKIFSIVAIFILVVACINFMNLSTARAAIRHKEIGVRKVVGAQRWVLIAQFISESMLVSAMAMIIAIFIVELSLPIFNSLVSKQITIQFNNPQFFIPVIIIIVVTGVLAGSYPALVLSKVNPVKALKGGSASIMQGTSLRKALVIFQFSISVILVVSSLVVYQQIEFIQSKNLGYNKDNVIVFPGRGIKDFESAKQQFLKVPGVTNVALANENIVNVQNQNNSFSWLGKTKDSQIYVRTLVVGYDFIETMGLKIAEGRSFKEELHDTANLIINKKMASLMGVKNPIGLETDQWGKHGKIIGIVDDFHIRSLSQSIDPVVIMCLPEWTGRFYLRIESGKEQQTLTEIEKAWKIASPKYPFEYGFLDQSFDHLYKEEQVISKLATGFTFIAILISALGLLGLASYSTERKKKEITIRKVLGASAPNLIMFMSTEFILLAIISLIIGCPLAYYFMNQFLKAYAYHISINSFVFVITGVGLLTITLAVIILQVSRAALTNPVDNLHNE